ncbi:hypothetical protein ALI144C_35965 [Actinosynnema sp. ALI-1.44]|nr:hypothetical protein ALI144C_35965 [Actinosynnema sp. ALI-1.44]
MATSLLAATTAAAAEQTGRDRPMTWAQCSGTGLPADLQCAELDVPVDWSRPHHRQITLDVARLPSTGTDRLGTVILVPGGPGGSGIDDLEQSASAFAALRQRFDVVSLAPRNRSDRAEFPTHCGRSGPWVTRPKDLAGYRALARTNQEASLKCRQADPELFDHLDSRSVARDLDAIRAAMGDTEVNLLANSYGGVPAVAYAREFPSRVRTMFFDGTGDPTASDAETDAIDYPNRERLFGRFIEWCDIDPACALHGEDVSAVWRGLLATADRTPVPATGEPPEVAYTGFDFVITAGNMMKNSARWSALAQGIDLARDGDSAMFVGWVRQSLGGNPKFPALPLARAVECADDAGYPSYAAYTQARHRGERLSPHLPGLWQRMPLMCAGWPHPVANPRDPLPAGKLPPLMIADQALDYPATAGLLSRVPGSGGVRYDGVGHGLYLLGQPCVIAHANRYFIDRTPPATTTICRP